MSQLSILLPFALPDTRLPLSPGALAALEHGRRSMPVRETGRDYLLFQLFGVPFFPGRLPAAPIAYWGASGEQSLQWCMRIDPVHLHARRHELVMVREPELGLLDGEAADLAAEVAALADAGCDPSGEETIAVSRTHLSVRRVAGAAPRAEDLFVAH